jgi:hypothetical protein
MTIARRHLVDVSITRWYHCMSRCVRGASLLSTGASNRKGWLEDRIEELAQIFAVGVGGFSVMDNHLHLLLRGFRGFRGHQGFRGFRGHHIQLGFRGHQGFRGHHIQLGSGDTIFN